jgi:GMP synthase-like glutamine amidotransferase
MVRQGGGALQRRARSVGNVNETLIHHLKTEKTIQAFNFLSVVVHQSGWASPLYAHYWCYLRATA